MQEDKRKVLDSNEELSEDVEELKEVLHDEKKKPNLLTEVN
jgi:hypothetical protein